MKSRYTFLPLRTVHKWEPLADHLGVSTVARSARGFLAQYEQHGRGLPPSWQRKRDAFIKRHMAQVHKRREPLMANGKPTRRHLALIMWAYSPQRSRL